MGDVPARAASADRTVSPPATEAGGLAAARSETLGRGIDRRRSGLWSVRAVAVSGRADAHRGGRHEAVTVRERSAPRPCHYERSEANSPSVHMSQEVASLRSQ